MTMRYDRVPIKATRTDDGYITDTPVLTRTGVFDYRAPDGSIRREYRPPEVVFDATSMASYRGVPITDGHPGRVNSQNAKRHVLGSVLSEARRDGDDVLADIIIYDPTPVDEGKVELSCGYLVELDETPGVTPTGEKYDVVQRSIHMNHLALVHRGRAGNARLNLDAADEAANHQEGNSNMEKVRLDNGLSYDAAPEVAQEMNRLRQDLAAANTARDQAQAKADTLQAQNTELQGSIERIRQDAASAAAARLKLEAQAQAMNVQFKADAQDREIQEAVIKAVRGDAFNMDGKSDDYVAAAYDMAIAERSTRQGNVAATRQAITSLNQDSATPAAGQQPVSASAARAAYIAGIRK